MNLGRHLYAIKDRVYGEWYCAVTGRYLTKYKQSRTLLPKPHAVAIMKLLREEWPELDFVLVRVP
jgi:hypothetical protein